MEVEGFGWCRSRTEKDEIAAVKNELQAMTAEADRL